MMFGKWWMVLCLFLAMALSYMDRFILSIMVDPIRAELHIGDTQIGLLQGFAFAIFYCVAGLPLGRMADIFPRRYFIFFGVLIWTCAMAFGGIAQGFLGLMLARIIVGVGEATLAPAAFSLISDAFPVSLRGKAIGLFMAGTDVGRAGAVILGGALLSVASSGAVQSIPVLSDMSSWRIVLISLAVPGAVVAGLLLTFYEPPRRAAGLQAQSSMREVIATLRRQSSILGPLYFAGAMTAVCHTALTAWTPAFLARRFELHADQIGTTLGPVTIVAGILGSLLGGAIADRMAEQQGIAGRLLVAAVAACLALPGTLIGLARTPTEALVLFGIVGFASGAIAAVGLTTVQEMVPGDMRGFCSATVSFVNIILGLGFGTLVTGLITDHFYGSPAMVGYSITTVGFPAAASVAASFFWLARALRHSSNEMHSKEREDAR